MKTFKPYLSLSKTADKYTLDVVLALTPKITIEKIEQQEIRNNDSIYWGVIITTSKKTQLMNGPELPIFSSSIDINLNKSETYTTIKCIVHEITSDINATPSQSEETDINFDDGN